MGENMDKFILLLYVVIILFFLYRLYKTQKSKQALDGELRSFARPQSSFENVLLTVLIITGIANLYFGYQQANTSAMLTSVVMIILAIVFYVTSKNKLYVAENGMLVNSSFYDYKAIKKWGFDKDKGDLVLQTKKDGQTTSEVIRVAKADMEEINTLIRRYKLKK